MRIAFIFFTLLALGTCSTLEKILSTEFIISPRSPDVRYAEKYVNCPRKCQLNSSRLYELPKAPGKVNMMLFTMTSGYYPTYFVYKRESSKEYKEKFMKRHPNEHYFDLDDTEQYLVEIGIDSSMTSSYESTTSYGEFILLVTPELTPVSALFNDDFFSPEIKLRYQYKRGRSILYLKEDGYWKICKGQDAFSNSNAIDVGRINWKMPFWYDPNYEMIGVFYEDNKICHQIGRPFHGIIGIIPRRNCPYVSKPMNEEVACGSYRALIGTDRLNWLIQKLQQGKLGPSGWRERFHYGANRIEDNVEEMGRNIKKGMHIIHNDIHNIKNNLKDVGKNAKNFGRSIKNIFRSTI